MAISGKVPTMTKPSQPMGVLEKFLSTPLATETDYQLGILLKLANAASETDNVRNKSRLSPASADSLLILNFAVDAIDE